jgi:hypothetical protein
MTEQTPEQRRHALAFNAVAPALKEHDQWLPLTVRKAVAEAVLAAVDHDDPLAQQDGLLDTLAPMFDALHGLLATSSRDWSEYRVDAWLWAVLCGWDCEQETHDETCVHGSLEEMQRLHGWDDAAVAKARRYRAAVRAVEALVEEAGR